MVGGDQMNVLKMVPGTMTIGASFQGAILGLGLKEMVPWGEEESQEEGGEGGEEGDDTCY